MPAHPHPITLYAKSGSAYGYCSQLAIVDEYGVALVVLTAGDPNALPYLYDAMLHVVVPAVDQAAREQAAATFTGTYVSLPSPSPTTNTTTTASVNVNATIIQDDASLILSSLHRNNASILAAMHQIWTATIGANAPPLVPRFRLFPTKLVSGTTSDHERRVVREVWHLWLEPVYPPSSDLPGSGLGAAECTAWMNGDWLHYGGEPLDRVVFVRDAETGEVLGLEVPFLRAGLLRRVKGG